MLTRLAIVGVALAALLNGIACAQAGVVIVVNKATQRLSVSVDGAPRYEWPVSTARMGYNTPNGTYGVERMARLLVLAQNTTRRRCRIRSSSTAAMPSHAATRSGASARRPRTAASACIPNNATTLYNLVEQHRVRRASSSPATGRPRSYMSSVRRRAPPGTTIVRRAAAAPVAPVYVRTRLSFAAQPCAHAAARDFEEIFNN